MKGDYSRSEHFKITDTIGVPHPYCITPKHVAYASDHCSGILDEDAIRRAEKQGARCDICKGELSYDQHEHALVVECHADPDDHEQELREMLESNVKEATANGYAGFAFVKKF